MRKPIPTEDRFADEPVSESIYKESDTADLVSAGARPLFTIRVTRRAMKWIALALAIIIVVLVLARVFHFHDWGLSAQEVQVRETAALVEKVGDLMLLPSGETPVVATVSDAASLKSEQQFYKDAENGDVLLVYSEAERAILYRPSANKIINVGPVYLNQSGTTTPAASAPAAPASANASSIATTTAS